MSISEMDHAATLILQLATGEPYWKSYLSRPKLTRIMYYPEVRYAMYLRAVQRVHPFFGGSVERFEALRAAKQLLDLREVMPEEELVSDDRPTASMSPA